MLTDVAVFKNDVRNNGSEGYDSYLLKEAQILLAALLNNAKAKVVFSMVALLTWIPPLLITLGLVSLLDFIGGILANRASGREFSSEKFKRILCVDLLLILLAASGYIVHEALPQQIKAGIPLGANLGSFFTGWIIYTKFMSIVKSVKRTGYMFPWPMEKALMITITDDAKDKLIQPTNKKIDIKQP